jgi:glycosyltransferase involved in cell wall biosynthesis
VADRVHGGAVADGVHGGGPRVLVLGHTAVGSTMASGGIRSFNIARVLHEHVPGATVTLAIPRTSPSDLDPASVPFRFIRHDGANIGRLAREHDIIISQRFPVKMLPYAYDRRLVLDLFTPFITEWVEMTKRDPGEAHRRAWIDMKRRDLITQIASADTILCSNIRQRDLIAGIMGTAGLISPRMFDADPTLERLIRVAPIGVRPVAPVAGPPRLRGVWPGIGEDDFIIIWNGIIVDWYDIDLLLAAVNRLKDRHPNLRLFFMGTEHPDSHGSKPLHGLGGGTTQKALRTCEDYGILDKHVFFNFTWADNEATQQYLLESDISVCTYFDSLETRYSFRVRYLDCFWAGLPLVCTQGDLVADMVDDRQLGASVPEGDLDVLVAAIDRLAGDRQFRESCRRNVETVREEFRWESTLAPLIEYCRQPGRNVARRQQRWPMALHAADWFASRAYYEARFGLRRQLAIWWARRREGTA